MLYFTLAHRRSESRRSTMEVEDDDGSDSASDHDVPVPGTNIDTADDCAKATDVYRNAMSG